MSFLNKLKRATISGRVMDEQIYDLVLREIESGERRGGLWLKAIENSGGDEKQTKSLYIKYRVQAMRDELDIFATIADTTSSRPTAPDPLDGHDSDGHTPLMRAVLSDDISQVRLLIERGVNVQIKDSTFGTSTALDMAHLSLHRASSETEISVRNKIIEALNIASQRI